VGREQPLRPEKWDTAVPIYTGTPWLHPPTWTPGQDWGALSGNWRTATALTGSWGGARDTLFSDDLPGQDGETLLELNYRVQIAPWAFVQPDLQYIIDPGGRSDIDDALVLGFAVGVAFRPCDSHGRPRCVRARCGPGSAGALASLRGP
jgi:hypothetical protein